jgi:hypothetical protein
LVPDGAWAAINGGYFNPDFTPTNWARDRKHTLGKKHVVAARGGVLAVNGERIYIGPQSGLPFTAQFAIHNSPLLIEADGKIGIKKDDGRRASRTIACVLGATGAKVRELRLIVVQAGTGQGPTLMEAAHVLAAPRAKGGFGCSTALNLDGGPSSGVWLRSGIGATSSLPLVPIGYAIAVMSR